MNHEPDPRFVEHLEWQLRTAARRQGRFARPVPSLPVRALRTAALVLVSLLGGAGVVMAADHLQDQDRRERLVARLEVEVRMAELRHRHAVERLQHTARLVERGLVAEPELAREELRRVEADVEWFVRVLDLEEVRATGREPCHELAAPLVGGRDLVRMRLERRRQVLVLRLEALEERAARNAELAEAGRVSPRERAGDEAGLREAREELQLLDERVELRARFLAGEIDARAVDLLERLAATRWAIAGQRARVAGLEEELADARRLAAAGAVQQRDARALELELELARSELRLRELELDELERRARGR